MFQLRRAPNNKKGFSLIEMMIAMVIIMISMLALLTAVVTSERANHETELRNTAIRLTNQTAEALLGISLSDTELSVNPPGSPHSRTSGNSTQNDKGFPEPIQTIRGGRVTYTIQWDVVEQTVNVRQVTIAVGYTYRNQNRTNTSVIYKHKAL